MNSLRYWLFKEKGTKCVCCGLEGKFFAVESSHGSNQWHLNLYAVDKNGNEILMTKDHIMPQSKCKTDDKFSLDNLQPMCTICNGKKKDKTLMELQE